MRRLLIGITCLAALSFLPGEIRAKYDPRLSWKTITTEHFYVHFHDGEDALAQKYAALAEARYEPMVKKLGHEPYFRTHLVVSDIYDDANGSTTVEPWNRVELFAAKPLPGSTFGNYGDWDDLLFTHEYTHVLNIDQIRGLPALSRYVLGRYYFPNEWQPLWIIEGSAVAEESATGFGRNNSSMVEMYFRTAVEGDSLKSINRSSNFIRDFPSGDVYYFYGGRFIAWLKKKYPGKNFHDIHAENADNVWPFLNNTNARDVFGEAFTDLWEEWQKDLTREQTERLAEIKKGGVTELTHLTEADFYQTFPRFDKTGKVVWFLKQNNYERPTLQRLGIHSKKGSGKSRELNAPVFLTMHAGDPYVVDNELYRTFSAHNDVFGPGEQGQLTEKLRPVSLDFTAEGQMLTVTQNAGEYTLSLLDKTGKIIKTLLGPTTTTLAHARLSPDGKKIVFSALSRERASTNLYLIDRESGELQQLTEGKGTDIHPAFYPAGDKIAFVSDRTGVFNLYALELANGELTRLTNLTGGAFYPDVAPDARTIALSEFNDKGYRIALYENASPSFEKQTMASRKIPVTDLTYANKTDKPLTAKDYSIFPSILPSSWSPLASFYSNNGLPASLGFAISGMDALQRDFFGLSYVRGLNSGNNYMDFYLETQRFYPDFYIAPYFSAGDYCGGLCYAGFSAGALVPFYRYYTRHMGYATGYYDYDRQFSARTSSFLLGYSFSNTQFFARSVSPENGRAFGLSLAHRSDAYSYIDYEYSGSFAQVAASYAEYLPGFFRNHVFMARAYVAQSLNVGSGYLGFFDTARFSVFAPGTRVRGYAYGNVGTGLTVFSFEYRFPIYQPDWGFFRVPVFFKDFYGKIFADAGSSYVYEPNFSRMKTSAGAEIGLSSVFGFRYSWSAFIGYARGFNEGGEDQVYFAIQGYTGYLLAKYSPHAEHR